MIDASDIGHFIEDTNNAETADSLFLHLNREIAKFGFNRSLFAGGSVDLMFRERYGISSATPIIINNYPDHWTSHYLDRNYIRVDPVFAAVRRQFDPVFWDGLKGLTGIEKTLMDEAREAGLYNGISLPLHGRDGDTFVFSIASDAGHDLRLKQHFPYVRLLAAQFFFRFNDLLAERQAPPPAPALTAREIECLQWACHGKSAWEIGTILHISEATVRFHLSNAFTKLGAPNRINAIVRAVRLGLISI